MRLVSVAQLSWPHFGRTRTLNAAIYCAPVSSISAGQRGNGQVADRRDTVYGSEGWGFESLRARPGQRPVAHPAAGFLAVLGATLGETRTYQPPNSTRLIDSAAARLSPSSRCPYTSLVMAMLACPSTSETTCSGVPGPASARRPSGVAHADANDPGPPARTACRARCCRSLTTSSGVSVSRRRDFGVFSSVITSRVRRPDEASRSLTRLTPCVTRSVPASQSRAAQPARAPCAVPSA
jgi:hypothetical protein